MGCEIFPELQKQGDQVPVGRSPSSNIKRNARVVDEHGEKVDRNGFCAAIGGGGNCERCPLIIKFGGKV